MYRGIRGEYPVLRNGNATVFASAEEAQRVASRLRNNRGWVIVGC